MIFAVVRYCYPRCTAEFQICIIYEILPWFPQKGPLLMSQVVQQPASTVALWKDVTHAQFINLKFSPAQ